MESVDGDPTTAVIVVTEVEAEAEREPEADEAAAADGSVSEHVEGVARAAGLVALRGADVIAARRQPDVRRAVLDLGSLAIVVAAAITAFALAAGAFVRRRRPNHVDRRTSRPRKRPPAVSRPTRSAARWKSSSAERGNVRRAISLRNQRHKRSNSFR